MGKRKAQQNPYYDQSPMGFPQGLNFQEFENSGKAQLSNILAAGAAVGLMSWYSGDSQNESLMKAATMAAGQFAGSSLVDILSKNGKLADHSSNLAKSIEVAGSAGFYSVVALRGWRWPNVDNKQFQEAIIGSVVGVLGGPYIDNQLANRSN